MTHVHLEPGEVPEEYSEWLISHSDEMFDAMRRYGNSKDDLQACLDMLLGELQSIVVKHSSQLTQSENNACSATFVIVCALLKVAFKNPLYNSPELTDQLKVELRRILKGSRAIEIHKSADD